MSNVHLFLEQESGTGDVIDIHYYCHFCGTQRALPDWPAPESLDYPVCCEDCKDRLPVPLTQDGERYMDEVMPKYAWPGGYTVVYYDKDGEVWCPDCRREANPEYGFSSPQTYDEGPIIQCAECNGDIESSYGDPDASDDS